MPDAAGGETKVVHRIAVFESHGEITNVISQTDVMRCALLMPAAVLLAKLSLILSP